ncbi:MAG: C25 family cysteine peptidase [Candidatus Krumholzibacteriia bacterium]
MRAQPLILLLGLALLAAPLLAAEPGVDALSLKADGTVGKPSLEIVGRSASGLTLSLEIPSLEVSDLVLGDQTFKTLAVPEGGALGLEGQPALPTFTRLVALPAGSGVQVKVVGRELKDLGTMRLAPNLGIADKDAAGPLRFDARSYATSPASEATATVGEPALMHGQRVVPVTFSPVAYDPATGRTQVAERMAVEVTFAGRDTRNDQASRPRQIPESFDAIFQDEIVGYQRGGDVQVGPGSYVVICPNNASVISILEPLLEWRRRLGYNVVLATTAQTGTTNTAIKSWLQSQYNTLDPALEFVVLVGDANGAITIPSWRESYSGYNGEGDHDYTLLDGGDVLADVHIGRLSVTSTAELQTVVDKIVSYESDPDMSDPSWFTTAGLVGDPSSSGMSTIFVNQFVKEQLLDLGYTRIDTIWSGNFLTQMLATLNQGESVFCYRGYWQMSGMAPSYITSLSNGRQLPFACILTCDTGSFWSDTVCRSEAFLRAANGGGVASIGTATTGTHTRYNNCMFVGTMNGILNSDEHRVGPSVTRGKLNLYNNYWTNEWQKVWIWSTWNNLMGDPATEIFTGVPATLSVSHPAQVAVGANGLPVTVTEGGVALAGARVAAYKAGEVSSFGYTDAAGQVVLDITGASGGDVEVTVTGRNLRPYLGATAVGAVNRSLDFASLTIQDVVGNADGFANPGETLNLQVALTNHGANAVSGAVAELATGLDYVSVLTTDASYGTVAAGATVSRTFQVRLDAQAPGGATAPLRLTATAGAEAWTSLVNLAVRGPRGSFNRFTFGGPGDNVDPGESGTVTFDLANVGDLATGGVTANLSCDSQWVTVTDAAGSWGASRSTPPCRRPAASRSAWRPTASRPPGRAPGRADVRRGRHPDDRLPREGGHGPGRRPDRTGRLRLLRVRQHRHGRRGARLRLGGARGPGHQHRHQRQRRRRRRDPQLRPAVHLHLLRAELRPRVDLLQRLAEPRPRHLPEALPQLDAAVGRLARRDDRRVLGRPRQRHRLHLARHGQPPVHRAVGRLRRQLELEPRSLQRQLHVRDPALRSRLPQHGFGRRHHRDSVPGRHHLRR